MHVTAIHDESNLEELAKRLYSKLTEESRKLAETSLLKANPNLAKSEAFRPGVVIQIPDVPSLNLNLALLAQDDPISQNREVLIQVLDSYQKALGESNKSVLTELAGQIRLLDQREIVRVLNPTIKDLKSLVNKRIKDNETHHNKLIAALEQAKKDMK